MKRGDIFYGDLSPVVGSEQGGVRPLLILSNALGIRYSPVLTVAPISSSPIKHQRPKKMPTHVFLEANKHGLDRDSIVYLEQTRCVDKLRLGDYITTLNQEKMIEVNSALEINTSPTYGTELQFT